LCSVVSNRRAAEKRDELAPFLIELHSVRRQLAAPLSASSHQYYIPAPSCMQVSYRLWQTRCVPQCDRTCEQVARSWADASL
jgi:hypothetical protein